MSNAPNDDPEEFMVRYERQQAERRRKAEERKRNTERRVAYLCGALRFFGVQKITADWDGYGDDGTIEEAVFHPPVPAELPFGLRDEVDRIWDAFLPPGCEINAGSFGTLTLDVTTGGVHEEIEYREEEKLPEWDDEEAQ